MASLPGYLCSGLLIYCLLCSCLSDFSLFIFLYGMISHQYLFPQSVCRAGHQPAARLFLSSRPDFFDAFLKMPNRKFRMKIVSGEAFSDETALPWEGGRIYNPESSCNSKGKELATLFLYVSGVFMQNRNLSGLTFLTGTRKMSTISGPKAEFWQILFHGVHCILKRSHVSITVKSGTFRENKSFFSFPGCNGL